MYRLVRDLLLLLWSLIRGSFNVGMRVARAIGMEIFRGLITYIVVLKVLNSERHS